MSTSKRFKNLENAFNLDSAESSSSDNDEIQTSNVDDIASDDNEVQAALEKAKQISDISDMRGFDVHDKEMDELAQMAIEAHQSLQDLGMNVEIRHAGEIFSSSSQMLKIAVDAKNSKVDKKLRLLKLQLDKMKIDMAAKKDDGAVDGTAMKMDRNDLLEQLKKMQQDEGSK